MSDRRIYKWRLPVVGGKTLVDMPDDAIILAVQGQYDAVCVWTLCEPAKPLRSHVFHTILTGEVLPVTLVGSSYLATVQLHGGGFVVHVFYEGPTYAG